METVTFSKKEYSDLVEVKERLEEILRNKRRKASFKKDGFLKAFGLLKGKLKGSSSDYVSKLRKEWRK